MAWYVVVTRDKSRLAIKDFATLDGAGNMIFRDRTFDRLWDLVLLMYPGWFLKK